VEGRAHHHSVHRIVLPSGRKIEVVRFNDGLTERAARPLHVCRNCAAPLVQPLSWAETEDDQWELELACPNCSWSMTGVFNQSEVEELEDRLEEGLSEMLADLHRLAQANMTEEVERFIAALDANGILPEDF
jgi:DNA-directed RNA polymerase subunit RPC12/RpoP